MIEWKEHKLGELAEVVKETYNPDGSDNFRYIGLEHIEQETLRLNSFGFSSDVTSNKFKFKNGDILFGKLRPYFRKVVITKFHGICSTDIWVIRAKEDVVQNFLFYFLTNWDFINLANNSNIGTRMPRADWSFLKDTDWLIPSYEEQKAIASVLSSLDNKIDLLHRQNQTLEAMAETLFRQWFIEEAEENWEKGKLGDYMTIKHGYAFKGDFITPEETDKILVTPGNFKVGGGFSFHKFKYYTDNGFPESYILNEGDFIVTMTDLSVSNDSLGYPAFVPAIADKFLLHNQRVGKVLIKKGDESKSLFLYYLMKTSDYRHYILGSCTGTNVSHTSPSIICEYEFNVPDASKIISFKNQVQSLQVKQQSNIRQIQTLTQLRDTLLPKLMSGEVRVSEK